MFILDSNRYSQDAAGVSGQILQTIQKAGGEILVSRLWEERRLAFPISGHRKGAYWLTYFKGPGSAVAELNRQFLINENVLRSLILRVDPRIADTLVEHARTGQKPRAPEPAPRPVERVPSAQDALAALDDDAIPTGLEEE
jgi:small subunit ribosomal protein S6